MATKKRKRKKRSSAVKTYRYIQKQRRRRSRLHPTRRKQENFAILGAVASLPLLFFIGIPAAVFAGVASGGLALASKGTPPPPQGSKKRKNVSRKKAVPKMSGADAIRLKKRMMACSKACKMSTHPKNTCDCICGGVTHGSECTGVPGSTTPNKVRRRRG